MGLFKKREKAEEKSAVPMLVAVIQNTVTSEIFQDILKENGIPFICRQEGAGGCLKIVTGGLLVADSIYVEDKNLHKATELYEAYLNTEIADNEEA